MTRTTQDEIEVPGTPEQVWAAIATGPGIEAWFVPAEVEPRAGGRVALDMGSGMEDAGVVTAWEPPHRFVYEEEWEAIENEPAGRIASEFLVEARSGGTCVVRLVTTLHADGESWDEVLDSMRDGWRVYLLNLRLHLTHFAGQSCTTIMVAGRTAGPPERAWAELAGALGLAEAAEGEHVAAAGAPMLAGTVEHRGERELMLRLTAPAPGIALVYVYAWREHVVTNVHAYLFGDVAPSEAQAWREWMRERFPAEAAAGA